MNFESQDVTGLCDARRLQGHQFTDKAIDSSETMKQFVAESFHQGFVALPKGGYGGPYRKMILLSRRAAHVCRHQRRDRGETCTPRAVRATWPPEVAAEVGANVVSAGQRARSLPRRDGPANLNRGPERPPQGPGTREAVVYAADAIPADGF